MILYIVSEFHTSANVIRDRFGSASVSLFPIESCYDIGISIRHYGITLRMAKAIPILPLLICIVLVVQPAPHCAISFSPDFNPIDLGLKNRPMEGIALRCCIVMEQPYVVIDASEYVRRKAV